ncbi:phage tail protein [Bradyrhizobium sp. SZCCHNS3051]|uniref:phage tail protein n=1 Tax=Bradyrhizobium sp. SZCCHNS3051 TaxID=3057320 RepID=UPI0029162292|nr:phage tail protein [Bradyrhizobium sp. SZCCHNS3051]
MEAQRIARLLPEIFAAAHQPGSVLDAVLGVMEAFHAPNEALLMDLDATFDPWRAPDGFVTLMASWLALDPYIDAEAGEGDDRRGRAAVDTANLRELISHAAELDRIRGTVGSLIRFLELATGLQGFELRDGPPDVNGKPSAFAARLAAPASARSCQQLVELIVAREKPAFTTIEITYQDS